MNVAPNRAQFKPKSGRSLARPIGGQPLEHGYDEWHTVSTGQGSAEGLAAAKGHRHGFDGQRPRDEACRLRFGVHSAADTADDTHTSQFSSRIPSLSKLSSEVTTVVPCAISCAATARSKSLIRFADCPCHASDPPKGPRVERPPRDAAHRS